MQLFIVGILWTLLFSQSNLETYATLITVPPLNNNELTVCPGEEISITCTHNETVDATRWAVSGPVECFEIIPHGTAPDPSGLSCTFMSDVILQLTMISNSTSSIRRSTAQTIASQILNGSVVTCHAGVTDTAPLIGDFSLQTISIPTSGLNLQMVSNQLRWDLPVQNADYQSCISSYTVEWNGAVFNTINTSVSLETLSNELGFPFCRLETVTVTAVDRPDSAWNSTASIQTNLLIQELVVPMVNVQQLSEGEFPSFQINIQKVADTLVPSRMYGYTDSPVPQNCIPNITFSGSTVVTDGLDLEENMITFCVRFSNNDCNLEATNSTTIQVSIEPTIGGTMTPPDSTELIVGVVVAVIGIVLITLAVILVVASLIWMKGRRQRKVHASIPDINDTNSPPITEQTQPESVEFSDYAVPKDAIKNTSPNFGINPQRKTTNGSERKSNIISGQQEGVYAEVININSNGIRKTTGSKSDKKTPSTLV